MVWLRYRVMLLPCNWWINIVNLEKLSMLAGTTEEILLLMC